MGGGEDLKDFPGWSKLSDREAKGTVCEETEGFERITNYNESQVMEMRI